MPKPNKKDERMEIRLTSHQKLELEQIAEELDWSTSKLLRYTIDNLIYNWYDKKTNTTIKP